MTKSDDKSVSRDVGPLIDKLQLETDAGIVSLGANTLVVALDDTGHETFADPNYPLYGLGGCAFLVSDYKRLVQLPWDYMCQTFFSDIERPLHAADLHQPSPEQIEALTHYFSRFQVFRLVVTIHKKATNAEGFNLIEVVGKSMIERIVEIAKHVAFDRIFVIVEDSQRIGVKIMRGLSGRDIIRGDDRIKIELALMPKTTTMPALEVADFLIHTAGAQTRNRNKDPDQAVRKDYKIMFRDIDTRLVSGMEITRLSDVTGQS